MPVVPKLPRLAFWTLIISAVAMLTSPSQGAENCEPLKGCAWKMCQAQNEVDAARQTNPAAVPGAEKRLANVTTYCREDKERAKLLEEIDQAREKIAKLQNERTHKNAKPEKLVEIDAELDDERAQIDRLEAALDRFD